MNIFKKIKKRLSLDNQVIRLNKEDCLGTVVISYVTWPFQEGIHSPKARGHTNAFEVIAMAEAYHQLGYTVEVVDHDNRRYQPPKDASVVIDLHGRLEEWNPGLSKNCHRILHATGAHWLTANQAELERLAALRDRRGVVLMPRRQTTPSYSTDLADQIVVLGNDYTIESFSFAKKSITRIPLSSAYQFDWPEGRCFSQAKKKFLWLGSYGMVHKGLDLVLEAFAQMPEISLTVCGRPEKEPDFYQCYQKELLQTPNIHFHGWIDMASPEFQQIAQTHAAIIYPSCSEGGGGSVIHCMHAGMVPLCTREASVDLKDFGMLIKKGTVEAVMETARAFASLPDLEVEERAAASYHHARKVHTRDCFRKNYYEFAAPLLSS